MYTRSKVWLVVSFLVVFSMVLGACQATPATPQVIEKEKIVTQEVIKEVVTEKTVEVIKEVEVQVEVTPEPVTRSGAWMDTVIVIEEPSADAAVNRLAVGDIDLYAYAVSNAVVAQKVADTAGLASDRSFGSYNELSFNPVGPTFPDTGKFNPFSNPKLREAMNWAVDRDYIAQEIMNGMATPRWTAFNTASGDYALMADVIRAVELNYAYDLDKAIAAFEAEMPGMGAEKVNGVWNFEGEPIEISILIRTEDERRLVGDYVGNQLEQMGFTTFRNYKTAGEASPIWMGGNPAAGQWHIYTGGWVTTAVPRNLADNFAYFYTNMGLGRPLWQAYVNDPEFYDIADRLQNSDFKNVEERRELMAQALEMAMYDSHRVWLVDRAGVSPRRAEIKVAADLYAGVYGSSLWPYTIRREGEVGGSVTIATASILTQPWNPIGGSNWVYDAMLYRGTGETATFPDPYTGLALANRVESHDLTVQEGLPVGKTLDYVNLEFAASIDVPGDAWADWDATEQRFLTVSEVYTAGLPTALYKSVVTYPADLYDTVTWHDGSPFSAADVVMNMIMTFDRAKEDSPIYDESYVPDFDSFLSSFKGVKIVSTDPLVIETYADNWQMDAEQNIWTWWPYYDFGQAPWQTIAIASEVEAAGEAAYSNAKATAIEKEHISFIAGPTLALLKTAMDTLAAESTIPYAPTMSEFVTADEAAARYTSTVEWHRRRGHFWIGTGVFYLERAFPVEGTVILQRFDAYPDMADKWDRFSAAPLAEVELDGPGRVTIGQEASWDVYVEFDGEPYPNEDILSVKFLVFDANGASAVVKEATPVAEGLWEVVLTAAETQALPAGSNRLEVVVVSKRVAVPSSDSLQFVTE